MQYKTITLEFLKENHPLLHERLRKSRTLLQTVNALAGELKAKHTAWMEHFQAARPGSAPGQVASEALELAVEELQEALRQASSATAATPLSLDDAMTFLRQRTPPA